ncbi:MAG: nitrophenyl compound nitroreductase subunit ArsF family protein [Pirellulaceae bacterium]
MELKNAVAVCLISLFSATLVLLIARALDMQAAAKLEPQLVRIAEQLEAIRDQGGLPIVSSAASERDVTDDGLVVYYFHGNMRCATCRTIEAQSHDAVQTFFADELRSGEIVWRILNYEEEAGAELAKQFEILAPVVVLARMKDGQIDAWKRLDKVWALVGDKAAFVEFIRDETTQMLPSRVCQ